MMIWTGSEAKEIDRLSSEIHGIAPRDLMEEAGQAVFRLALSLWKPYRRFLVLAGPGNNGGDAYVCARHLHEHGFAYQLIDCVEAKETELRALVRKDYESRGGVQTELSNVSLADSEDIIVIDGLLGIGTQGELREGVIKSCLRKLSTYRFAEVLAIDLPSGMETDLWEQPEAILPASHTLTFGAFKPLHISQPSRKYCGEIHLAALSFASEAMKTVIARRSIALELANETRSLKELWSHLPADAHKYDRGHVLAIGGSAGKVGAILIAADSAWKVGAGWVSVAPLSDYLAPPFSREFTYESFALEGEVDRAYLLRFIQARKIRSVLIGPGTMNNPLTKELLEELANLQKMNGLRLIFDAGALDGFLDLARSISFQADLTLLTPHPGEWTRLQKNMPKLRGVADLQAAMACLNGLSLIYKSASPMVFTPGKVRFLTSGNNHLARAGSGDKLAGAILGLSPGPHSLAELAILAQNHLASLAKESFLE